MRRKSYTARSKAERDHYFYEVTTANLRARLLTLLRGKLFIICQEFEHPSNGFALYCAHFEPSHGWTQIRLRFFLICQHRVHLWLAQEEE